jgi:hypothetical protein
VRTAVFCPKLNESCIVVQMGSEICCVGTDGE